MQGFLKYFLPLFLILSLMNLQATAAPMLVPGQITSNSLPAEELKDRAEKWVGSFSFFTQKNKAQSGLDRFTWIDPEGEIEEERHKVRRWSQKNEMSGVSLKIARKFSALSLYALAGISQTDTLFSYSDETRRYLNSPYFYNETIKFKDESQIFFGCGISSSMGSWEINPETSILLDSDLSYRYHSLEPGDKDFKKLSADLHEAQFSIALAIRYNKWQPYGGVKISYLNSEINFEDKKENLKVKKNLEAAKNIGCVFGLTYSPLSWLDISFSSSYGDETGYLLECGFIY